MRQRRTFLLLSLILAILFLGIAYAAIDNVTLSIAGNVVATPDQGNFNVKFSGITDSSGTGTANLDITSNTSATMTVSGMSAFGDEITGKFQIINNSADITAELTTAATIDNTQYFKITTSVGDTTLSPGETTYFNIKVRLIKTPLSGNVKGIIDASLIASPSYS